MKKHLLISSFAGLTILLSGCVNPDGTVNNTGTGALVGASSGAFLGAVAGGPRNGGAGALIGAAAGLIAGSLIGNSIDHVQAARLQAQAPDTYTRVDQGQPLTLADVKALAKAGISEDVMINQIKNSRTIFHLGAADIIDLRDSGVTDKVINYMISTPTTVTDSQPAATVIQQAPPPPPVETVVVAPAPDYVWIGGEWVWNGGWFWSAGHWGYPPHPGAVWVGGRSWHDNHGWHNEHGHWR
jgi:outer membrane lipoprotein SlyB